MKQSINKFLNHFGYKVSRIRQNSIDYYVDPFEMQRRLVSNPDSNLVIFDVGAHHGNIAALYKQIFPKSKIFCFEPFPASYQMLQSLLGGNPDYKLFDFGLSDQSGMSKFYSNFYSPTNSLLKSDKNADIIWGNQLLDNKEIIEVKLRTLDEVIVDQGINQIDILKLDVQGAEPQVIKGALQSIKKGIIKLVYTEIIALPTYEGQVEFEEVIKLFKELGFELFSIYNNSYTSEGRLRQIDAIFTYKD